MLEEPAHGDTTVGTSCTLDVPFCTVSGNEEVDLVKEFFTCVFEELHAPDELNQVQHGKRDISFEMEEDIAFGDLWLMEGREAEVLEQAKCDKSNTEG